MNFRVFCTSGAAVLLLLVAACGQDNVDRLDRSSAEPRILSFEVAPSMIKPGVPTRVQFNWRYLWELRPDPTCEITNEVGVVQNGGYVTLTISGDTEFTLRCVNRSGEDSASLTLRASPNGAPEGDILLPPSVIVAPGESVSFVSTCKDDNTPGELLTHSWNFAGAALNTTAAQPGLVRFPSPGRYTVTYTCTDALGLADPTPDTVVVAVMDFEDAGQTALGGDPVAVRIADLNGDTLMDLAVARSSANQVSVLLQDVLNPGQFLPAVHYATGANPLALAVADVNGDLRPDIVTANYDDDTVSVLLQNATVAGTFDAAASIPVGNGPRALVVADLNGDGRLDIAAANELGNSVSLLRQDPAPELPGAFTTAASNYPTCAAPRSLSTGFLNAGTRPDLAAACSGASHVSILFQYDEPNDPGHFRPKVDYPAGPVPESIVVADFNGDNRPDIAVTNPGEGVVSVLLNNAAPLTMGTYGLRKTYAAGTTPRRLTSSDINNDTWADLIVANEGSSDVSILIASTATPGTFTAPRNFSSGTGPVWVAVGDVDGDGLPDLVTAEPAAGNLSVNWHSPARPGITQLRATPATTNTTSTISFFITGPATGGPFDWQLTLTDDAGAVLGTPSAGTCDTPVHCSGTSAAGTTITVTLTAGADTVATATAEVTDGALTDSFGIAVTVDLTPPPPPVITTNGGTDFNVIAEPVLIQGTTSADTAAMQVQLNGGDFMALSPYTAGSVNWTFNGTILFGTTNNYCFRALDAAGNIGDPTCINVTR